MANAELKTAPLPKEKQVDKWALENEYLAKEYDVNKKYVFQLAAENLDWIKPVMEVTGNKTRVLEKRQFKPYQNLVMSSQIVWKGSRVNIRYYDGCETIFVADQPKDKDLIDQLIKSTTKRSFLDGNLIIEGYDTQLLRFLDICSWNVESPFRTNTANGIFLAMNPDKKATIESTKLDNIEKALKLATDATDAKMMIHSAYLGLSIIDQISGNSLSPKEIRAAYRKKALEDSTNFINTYGNKLIEIKYYIEKALQDGTISNKLNPNKASWKSGTEITDISGLVSRDAIADRLLEFSQSEEGAEFLIQLKAIYS